MTYEPRGQPSSEMAAPMIRSDSPPAYDWALSKKLTPASYAAARQSRARPTSSWGPNDTHEPNDSTLTLRPDRPSLRYSICFAMTPFLDAFPLMAPAAPGRSGFDASLPAPTAP